jgi:hypothetical protein
MLKKVIKYEDFDGNEVEDTFYFHLSKAELIELEVSYKEGVVEALKKIVASDDGAEIIAQFKKIILLSYGQRSEDGKRFIKSDQLREEFSQTAAYSQFFMDLATDAGAAAAFINGIVPASLARDLETTDTSALSTMSKEELLAKLEEKPKE